MMHFNSLGALANHLSRVAKPAIKKQLAAALDEIGEGVAKDAQDSIGVQQSAIGQFGAWAPLAASTVERKARAGLGKGGDPTTPLWASGAFHDDIGHAVNKARLYVEIGTSKEYIIFTELGTARMQPRPVFGPAALRTVPKFKGRIQKYIAAGLVGGLGSMTFAGGAGTSGYSY